MINPIVAFAIGFLLGQKSKPKPHPGAPVPMSRALNRPPVKKRPQALRRPPISRPRAIAYRSGPKR